MFNLALLLLLLFFFMELCNFTLSILIFFDNNSVGKKIDIVRVKDVRRECEEEEEKERKKIKQMGNNQYQLLYYYMNMYQAVVMQNNGRKRYEIINLNLGSSQMMENYT
eukprot:TRINITY_DN2476_c0_g4_i5.p6 TRINITY_DN2476_c0_g4~~TRINITY_DN2476_c0_g4_i5.p6  ORF type:complete len:109 (+),score=10.59 TRINITY_DN2476_c0_g4_i5:1077-1403(+)